MQPPALRSRTRGKQTFYYCQINGKQRGLGTDRKAANKRTDDECKAAGMWDDNKSCRGFHRIPDVMRRIKAFGVVWNPEWSRSPRSQQATKRQ
jgi:hypothetical protein